MPTEKLLPMIEAATSAATRSSTSIPITRTTSAIITNLSHGHNKRPTIIIYPTVSPESIVIPIVSCIFGFPILALLVICCLRRRAKLARERERRRNYDLQDAAGLSLVRFSPIHRLTDGTKRAISLRSERSMSRGFPSLELDTVIEERSDAEQTQVTDLVTPDSPTETTRFNNFGS
uniref:CSON013068 protein n=1 Tax=Culicoides sonorensis TaxID=179676 RepID=A0A336MJ26_CULSO